MFVTHFSNSVIIPCLSSFVKNFFHLFLTDLFLLFLRISLFIITCVFLFVNMFFINLLAFFNVYFISLFPSIIRCQNPICKLCIMNGERGIWTLAPLLTTYSLSRGAPSASLGISPKCPLFNIHECSVIVQYFFLLFHLFLYWLILYFNPHYYLSMFLS